MTTTAEVGCSDAYSTDGEFELSLSPLSSLEGVNSSDVAHDTAKKQEGLGAASEEEDGEEEDEDSYEHHFSEERTHTTPASSHEESGDDASHERGDKSSHERGKNASHESDDASHESGSASSSSHENGHKASRGSSSSDKSSRDSGDDGGAGESNESVDDREDEFYEGSCSSTAPPPSDEIGQPTHVEMSEPPPVDEGEQQEEPVAPVQSKSCAVDEPLEAGGQEQSVASVQSETCVVDMPAGEPVGQPVNQQANETVGLSCKTPKQVPGGCVFCALQAACAVCAAIHFSCAIISRYHTRSSFCVPPLTDVFGSRWYQIRWCVYMIIVYWDAGGCSGVCNTPDTAAHSST